MTTLNDKPKPIKLKVKIDLLGLKNVLVGENGEEVQGVIDISAPVIEGGNFAYVNVRFAIETGTLILGADYK